jgi:hypothetical protein
MEAGTSTAVSVHPLSNKYACRRLANLFYYFASHQPITRHTYLRGVTLDDGCTCGNGVFGHIETVTPIATVPYENTAVPKRHNVCTKHLL